MKIGVSKRVLLYMAGGVWLIAGINILRIGIRTWTEIPLRGLTGIVGATAVFLLFFYLVFKRLYTKHTRRIGQKEKKSCPFSFFDVKGWIVMGVMIGLGVTVRKFKLLPDTFIAVFYTGLSVALIVTGILFVHYGWKYPKREK